MIRTSSFHPIFCCSTFLDAHILTICSASKKVLRRILDENTRSNIITFTFLSIFRCFVFLNCSCIHTYTARLKKLTPHLERKYLLKKKFILSMKILGSKALRHILGENTCSKFRTAPVIPAHAGIQSLIFSYAGKRSVFPGWAFHG